jgi:hypothetical protein
METVNVPMMRRPQRSFKLAEGPDNLHWGPSHAPAGVLGALPGAAFATGPGTLNEMTGGFENSRESLRFLVRIARFWLLPAGMDAADSGMACPAEVRKGVSKGRDCVNNLSVRTFRRVATNHNAIVFLPIAVAVRHG